MSNVAKKLKHNPLIEMEQTSKIYITDSKNIEESLKFINLIHKNNTGYFAIFQKGEYVSGRFFQDSPNWNQMSNYLHLKDLYLTINSFYIPQRKISCVRQINAFWVDLDYYKIDKYKNKTTYEMIEIMRADGMFKDLEPSFYVDSGNGLYIFYLIEDVPKQSKKLWSKIENKIVEKFTLYGADKGAKDIPRFLRIPGSINSKTGRRARLILPNQEPIRYELNKIRDIILPTLPYTKEEWLKLKAERKKKKKEAKNKINNNNNIRYIFNPSTLNYERMNDIKTLIEIRKNNVEGIRNTAFHLFTLFSFYHYGSDEKEKIWTSLINLNDTLIEPLRENELEDIYNSALGNTEIYETALMEYKNLKQKPNKTYFLREKGCYIYSNQKIIEKLNITPNEMEQLKILINVYEKNKRRRKKYKENKIEISKRRKEEYKNKLKQQGKLSREEQNTLIREKIKSLLDEGFKQKDIALQLDIGIATVKRHIKYIK